MKPSYRTTMIEMHTDFTRMAGIVCLLVAAAAFWAGLTFMASYRIASPAGIGLCVVLAYASSAALIYLTCARELARLYVDRKMRRMCAMGLRLYSVA